MDSIILPEPYVATGYTGHIPGARYRIGKNLATLTHQLFVNPCTPHSPILIVTNPNRKPRCESNPTQRHIELLKRREKYVDAVYKHPFLPGYEGHVPRVYSKVGERDVSAATLGVIEHQAEIDRLHCEREALLHRDLVHSGYGLFDLTLGERILPQVSYKLPLKPVMPRAKITRMDKCDDKPPQKPYNKFPAPHFLEYEDPHKYILYGYDGHVPLLQKRYGACNKQLTRDALCEFLKRRRMGALGKWCPTDDAVAFCPKDTRGADSRDCPDVDYTIYPYDCGMTPNYSGHIPGVYYAIGKGCGPASVNAKGFLEYYRNKKIPDDWECHCLKIEDPNKKVCS